MKKQWLLIGGLGALLLAAILIVNSGNSSEPAPAPAHQHQAAHAPTQMPATQTMPAHYTMPPARSSLGPTLDPEKFTGPTREAYRAAREIPQTLAQLPCYCHCDRGMGHKSLFSCYEDDHASHCATCVNEALLALKLEKEQKLSAAQIRDKIVEQFGQ
jgi:hypothetical protein